MTSVVPRLRRPKWDSSWNRPFAFCELLSQPLLWLPAIGMYGLAEFRRGQLRHSLYLLKVIRTGKQGPSRGVVW